MHVTGEIYPTEDSIKVDFIASLIVMYRAIYPAVYPSIYRQKTTLQSNSVACGLKMIEGSVAKVLSFGGNLCYFFGPGG